MNQFAGTTQPQGKSEQAKQLEDREPIDTSKSDAQYEETHAKEAERHFERHPHQRGLERPTEPARNADAKQNGIDSSFPRYVFKNGTGRVQTDTGAFTAESMIVHRREEYEELLRRGWSASPSEAGEMVKQKEDGTQTEAAAARGMK